MQRTAKEIKLEVAREAEDHNRMQRDHLQYRKLQNEGPSKPSLHRPLDKQTTFNESMSRVVKSEVDEDLGEIWIQRQWKRRLSKICKPRNNRKGSSPKNDSNSSKEDLRNDLGQRLLP